MVTSIEAPQEKEERYSVVSLIIKSKFVLTLVVNRITAVFIESEYIFTYMVLKTLTMKKIKKAIRKSSKSSMSSKSKGTVIASHSSSILLVTDTLSVNNENVTDEGVRDEREL